MGETACVLAIIVVVVVMCLPQSHRGMQGPAPLYYIGQNGQIILVVCK